MMTMKEIVKGMFEVSVARKGFPILKMKHEVTKAKLPVTQSTVY